MKYREAVKIAVNALRVNRARAILTILGIVIGIAAVIVVISAGQSIEKFIFSEIDSFGSNILQTEVKVPNTKYESAENATSQVQGVVITTLTLEDREAINRLPNIDKSYAAFIGQEVAQWEGNVKNSLIFGSNAEVMEIDSAKVSKGRFFNKEEDDSLARVAVLGSKIKEKLFGNSEAIGQNIKIRQLNFKVIGELESEGSSLFFDKDNVIYIPIQTGQKLLWGINHVTFITSHMIDPSLEDSTIADMEYLLRDRHDIKGNDPDKDDFAVSSLDDAKELLGTIIGGVSLLLIALASISLIVGGVGIMNIMYVSVAERTFEIGLRKSAGAKYKDIMRQFLTEAIVITAIGSVAGTILGIIINFLIYLVAQYQEFTWSWSLPPKALVIAIGFSMIIGLIFGIYPAKKAANLNPIDALRQS